MPLAGGGQMSGDLVAQLPDQIEVVQIAAQKLLETRELVKLCRMTQLEGQWDEAPFDRVLRQRAGFLEPLSLLNTPRRLKIGTGEHRNHHGRPARRTLELRAKFIARF